MKNWWNEVVVLDKVVKKIFEEMIFKQVFEWRERESGYLEWINVLGRGQSKYEGHKERACLMCSRNRKKGIREAGVEWGLGRNMN